MTEHEHSKPNSLEQNISGGNVTKFVPRSRQEGRNGEETAPGQTVHPTDHTHSDDDDDPGPTAA